MPDDLLYTEALQRFDELLQRACATSLAEPTAMALATADRSGQPSVRTVLLRAVDRRGFVFFTNSESRKGRELIENPRAALCLYWEPLTAQVRIEGHVEQVSPEESDAYWISRPRESQLGAWASLQSRVLPDRSLLEARVSELEQEYAGREVPRPDYWYGFRVIPRSIEFWRGQPARLHERTLYEHTPQGWVRSFLYP